MKKVADEYAAFAAEGGRPRLLLHVCCAPCMSAGIERLSERFDVTAYFYDPNITQRREYDKRLAAVHKLIGSLSLGIPVIGVGFCPAEYDAAVGDAGDIGLIKVSSNGIRPGLGANKKLERIGDVGIMGIVAEKSLFNYSLLNLTRLNLVWSMADIISSALSDFSSQTTKQIAV